MADWFVSPTGSDAAAGTTGAPFRSIVRGYNAASPGDRVRIRTGVYNEHLFPVKNSITFMRDTATDVPVLDGAGADYEAFSVDGITDLVLDGLEIRNYYLNGVRTGVAAPTTAANHKIRNCHIHHIGSADPARDTHQCGVTVSNGSGIEITGNRIHHIGPGGEAIGVWLLSTDACLVDNNLIYACRKEGVRDYFGRNCQMTNNRVFGCWVGLAVNESMSALMQNNYVAWCTNGFNPKHYNSSSSLANWGVGAPPAYCRIWHNTIYQCSAAHITQGPNAPIGTKLDIRNNIFAGFGSNAIWDFPSARTSDIIVDGNLYMEDTPGHQTMAFNYGSSFTWGGTPSYSTLAAVRANLGWEANGRNADPQLIDPLTLNFDYGASSPAAAGGVDLTSAGSTLGSQLGARGLAVSPVSYTEYPANTHGSVVSSKTASAFRTSISDRSQLSTMTTGTATEEWFILDLTIPRVINHFFLDVNAHFQSTNIKGYRFEYGDSVSGPWTICASGDNYDSAGASFKYELANQVTARFIRFTAVSSFGAASMIVSDMRPALLQSTGEEPPPPDPPPTPPPSTGAYWGIRRAG